MATRLCPFVVIPEFEPVTLAGQLGLLALLPRVNDRHPVAWIDRFGCDDFERIADVQSC